MDRQLTTLLVLFVLATAFCNILVAVDVTAVILAAAKAVSAGTSLTGTTLRGLMNNGYRVNCGIEINNWTRFPLTNPVVKIASGALEVPPGNILPAKREAMVARKASDTATGSYGTVSWLVEGGTRRIVIMWGAPYDFNFHSNWLAVGITSPGEIYHAQGNTWFNQMYYGTSSISLGFSRSEYYWESNPVIYQDDLIRISGTMSTGHLAEVKITVRPVNSSDLADPIKTLLNE